MKEVYAVRTQRGGIKTGVVFTTESGASTYASALGEMEGWTRVVTIPIDTVPVEASGPAEQGEMPKITIEARGEVLPPKRRR